MKFNISWNIFGRTFNFLIRSHPILDEYIGGITNKCKDGRYVLFLDYDNVPFEWIEEEINHLIKSKRIGEIYIFKTNNGYHAINTEKFYLENLLDIMKSTSMDKNYLNVPLHRARRIWTLRQTKKDGKYPQFVKKIKSNYGNRERSRPHNLWLRKIYNLKIPTILEDGEESLYTAHYHISK